MELKNRSFQYGKYRLAYVLHEVLPASPVLRTRSTFSKSVMVSGTVSILGTTELMFIEPGVTRCSAIAERPRCRVRYSFR